MLIDGVRMELFDSMRDVLVVLMLDKNGSGGLLVERFNAACMLN
jgi:hypothetical protein